MDDELDDLLLVGLQLDELLTACLAVTGPLRGTCSVCPTACLCQAVWVPGVSQVFSGEVFSAEVFSAEAAVVGCSAAREARSRSRSADGEAGSAV